MSLRRHWISDSLHNVSWNTYSENNHSGWHKKKKPDPEWKNCRAWRTRSNVAGAGWRATLAMPEDSWGQTILLGSKTPFPTPTLMFPFLNKEWAKQINDEILTVGPILQGMDGGKKPNIFINCKYKEENLADKWRWKLVEHSINMYKTLNSNGMNKCFCCCKNHLQQSSEKETDKNNGAIFSSPKWHFLVPGA